MATASPHAAGSNGDVIRQIKAELAFQDLTDEALAKRIDMHPSQLSRYLNFQREPKMAVLDRIAEALGTTVLELLQAARAKRGEEQ